ncbi:MAG: carbohydrate-binding protein [Oscillospiraceae bacterium]|nr:carbohydrate-binding protein [Oscillospiraceae bacterium]
MKRKYYALVLPLVAILSCLVFSITFVGDSDVSLAAAETFREVYEAEDAVLSGASVGSTLDDYSALGYVDGLPNGASITFTVEADRTAEFGVRLRYTNGTGSTRTVSVYVNGTKVRDSSLTRTINGTTWKTQLENLTLVQGTNTIMYRNDTANNCEDVRFDKISLSWMFEAETTSYATRLGGIGLDTDNHAGKSGDDIAYPANGTGRGLRFTVNVPVAGDYAMVIRYGAGHEDHDARSLSLFINTTNYTSGNRYKQLQFPSTRTWNNWSDFVWNITLSEGENTVTIYYLSGDNGQMNVDYITLKPVAWTYAGGIEGVAGGGSSEVTFTLDNAKVKVNSVDKNAVKVWLEPFGDFDRRYDSFSVVNEAVDPKPLNVVDKTDYYEIDAGNIFVRFQKNPFKITYLDKSGNILCENENESMGWTTDGELTVKSKLQADEQFWGLGEKLASFNRRGTKLAMWSHDAYGNILNSSVPTELLEGRYYSSNPYFVSSKGYSILFDNSSRTVFDLGQSNSSAYSFGTYNPNPGNELVYYFIYGPEIKQLTKTFTDIIGKTFFAPEWAYGNIQCHYGYRQTDVESVAQTYRDKKIPIDMIMADIEWYDTQCTPTAWHRTFFPNPVSMLEKLKNLNIRMGLIDDPNVSAVAVSGQTPPDYVYGNSMGYFAKDHTDQTKVIRWPWGLSFGNRGAGDSGLTDFFNPNARTWWGNQHNMILDQGVEAFWLDMNEPAKYHMDWLFWNKPGKAWGTISEVKNAFAIMHNKTMYDKLHENGDRSLLLSRSVYTGSQRYVSPWTGDVNGDYNSLAQQVNLGISLSLTGYNYWGFDIGGFFSSIDNTLYKRWIELACFTPIHRFHYCDGVEAKEPWTHQSEDVSRFYINLRYELKPYMYSLTADNILGIGIEKGYGLGGTGIPYVRPMVMEYPNDPNTYNMATQFMAGPSFLVAPVIENATRKQVYLPEGHWYDYFNAPLIYDGGVSMSYDAPAEVLPLFVKEGSIIPMYPLTQYWGEKPVDEITLDIYPTVEDGNFGFVHYEDDSETEDYLNGVFTTTTYDCNASYDNDNVAYTLKIGARTGAYTDIAPRGYLLKFHSGYLKNVVVKLGSARLEAKITVDSLKASTSGYCVDGAICYVKIGDTGLAMAVEVTGEKIDGTSFEFEDGIIFGDAVFSNAVVGFSGDGYVTGLNTSSDAVGINFLMESAGLYPVYIRYQADMDTTLSVASGSETAAVALSGRSNNIWEETVVLLNLKRGGNSVWVYGTGSSGGALIDCLSIGGETYQMPSYSNIVEAENAALLGGASVSSSTSGFSGTGYAQNLTSTGRGVRFEGVKVKEAGRYAVKIVYRNSNATTRTLHIYPNGDTTLSQVIRLPRFRPSNSQVSWGEAQITIPLQAGENTVTLIREASDNNGTGNDIFIDYLYYPLEELDLTEYSVTNGGFETGNTNGWTMTQTRSGSYGVDSNDAIMEGYKLYTYNSGGQTTVTATQTVSNLPNGSYLVEFWAKLYNSAPNVCELRLTGFDGAATLNYTIPHNGAWEHFSHPVEIKDGRITLQFYHDAPTTSSLQLDDVKLWKIESYKPYLKDALGAAITECEQLKRSDYTATSFNHLQAALQIAKQWYADPFAGPDRYASALEQLEIATAGLVLYQGSSIPVFKDDAGNVIEPFDLDVVNISFSYTNTELETLPLMMIVAVYTNDGKMKYYDADDSQTLASGETGAFSVRLSMPDNVNGAFASGGYSICVFLWRSDTYVPVMPAFRDFRGK